jgi:hypothetical protein
MKFWYPSLFLFTLQFSAQGCGSESKALGDDAGPTPDVSDSSTAETTADGSESTEVSMDIGPGDTSEADSGEIDPMATACTNAGGSWDGAACACPGDPARPGLPFEFDEESGCRPESSALCVATGGVWENDACACAQDGVSLHYEFDGNIGCAFPDLEPLKEDLARLPLLEAIAAYASVEQHIWLIDRPGVFDMVRRVDSLEDLDAALAPWKALSDEAAACEEPLQPGPLPEVMCEDDAGVSKSGCIFMQVSDEYHRVSELMALAVTYEFDDWTPEEIAAVENEEDDILAVFLNSEHGVTLAFRRLEGRWVLVVIDLSRYSCSS